MGILGHFRGVRIRKGVAIFPHTGVEIPLNKRFFEDAISVVKFNGFLLAQRWGRRLKGRRPVATLAFYPQPSGPWYNAWLAARMGDVALTRDPQDAEAVFVFDDSTASDTGTALDAALKAKAINHRINDISKKYVAEVFEDVFGYSVEIDPLTHQGKAVQKSDINATHDGQVIECPIDPSEVQAGSVYQKLVDSTYSDRGAEDLRLSYVGGEIPVVFHKYKVLSKRFSTDYAHVDVWETDKAFSAEEQAQLIAFCGAMGLDFGSVDVMRDKHDGRIYVVDVNKTCMPVLCLSLKEQRRAFRLISAAFLRLVERVTA